MFPTDPVAGGLANDVVYGCRGGRGIESAEKSFTGPPDRRSSEPARRPDERTTENSRREPPQSGSGKRSSIAHPKYRANLRPFSIVIIA